MRAVLFPGQGSQYVGMGSDFYERFESVKTVFKTVDKTLGFSLSNLILYGPEKELILRSNMHGSLGQGPNEGPSGIMSLDSQGDYTPDRSPQGQQSSPGGPDRSRQGQAQHEQHRPVWFLTNFCS